MVTLTTEEIDFLLGVAEANEDTTVIGIVIEIVESGRGLNSDQSMDVEDLLYGTDCWHAEPTLGKSILNKIQLGE